MLKRTTTLGWSQSPFLVQRAHFWDKRSWDKILYEFCFEQGKTLDSLRDRIPFLDKTEIGTKSFLGQNSNLT